MYNNNYKYNNACINSIIAHIIASRTCVYLIDIVDQLTLLNNDQKKEGKN